MLKGILFGLAAQFIFAIGLIFINRAAPLNQDLLKSSLVLIFAALISLPIAVYFFLAKPEHLSVLSAGNTLYLVFGALFFLIVGDYLYIKGMSESNATAVALTAMAFPIFVFVMEYLESKYFGHKIPVIQKQHIAGFFLLVAGYILISTK